MNFTSNITCMQQVTNNTMKSLGSVIKKIRLDRGRTLNSIVFEKGGITTATWSRVENGLVDVKFSTLVTISAILGMSVMDLLSKVDIDYTIEE